MPWIKQIRKATILGLATPRWSLTWVDKSRQPLVVHCHSLFVFAQHPNQFSRVHVCVINNGEPVSLSLQVGKSDLPSHLRVSSQNIWKNVTKSVAKERNTNFIKQCGFSVHRLSRQSNVRSGCSWKIFLMESFKIFWCSEFSHFSGERRKWRKSYESIEAKLVQGSVQLQVSKN